MLEEIAHHPATKQVAVEGLALLVEIAQQMLEMVEHHFQILLLEHQSVMAVAAVVVVVVVLMELAVVQEQEMVAVDLPQSQMLAQVAVVLLQALAAQAHQASLLL
jgi:hypothetical protein